MTNPVSHGRALTSAPHLARGFTVSGAFSPRPLALNDQQLRHHNAKLARSVLPAGMIDHLHKNRFGSFRERNHG